MGYDADAGMLRHFLTNFSSSPFIFMVLYFDQRYFYSDDKTRISNVLKGERVAIFQVSDRVIYIVKDM